MSISVTAEDGVATNMGRRLSAIEWGGDRRKSRMGSVGLVDEAQEAADQERSMGVWQSIKTYPKACGWSVLASTALVMEGYDLVVIGSFFGFREFIHEVTIHVASTDRRKAEFQKKYGTPTGDGNYVVSVAWQSGLSNGALVGEILGLMACGIIADRTGYRFTIAMVSVMVVGRHVFTLRHELTRRRSASSSSPSSLSISRCFWWERSCVGCPGAAFRPSPRHTRRK